MNPTNDLEKCLSFINCHVQSARQQFGFQEIPHAFRAITISRQAGTGGHAIAERLAEYLEDQEGVMGRAWTVFDRNLVEKVLEDHNLPSRLAKFMPEDHIPEINDILDELFGLHPPSWILVRKTAETILHLAHLGHVILIGRGANVVTSRLPHVFHVRLVGSLHQRIKRFEESNALSPKDALKRVEREDLARQRYVKQFFGKDISDPLLYHLVLNTDLISLAEAARIIALAIAPKAPVLEIEHSG